MLVAEAMDMLRSSTFFVTSVVATLTVATSADCRAEEPNTPPTTERTHTRAVEADKAASEPSSPTSYHGKPFTFDGTIGWESADLTTFRSSLGARSFTADVIPAQLSGPSAGLGFGFRLYSLTLGVRGGVAFLDNPSIHDPLELYSVDAEVGLKIPFDRIELSLLAGGGYSVIGGLSDLVSGLGAGLNVDGANARLAIGLDFYFSNEFSIGGRATAELLFLGRRGVALRDIPNRVTTVDGVENGLLAGSGSTIGTALNFSVGPAFHF